MPNVTLQGEILLGTILAIFCLCIPWARMSPRNLTFAKVLRVLTDKQFLLLVAFFACGFTTFLYAKHRSDQQSIWGLQLRNYVSKLSDGNPDYRNLHMVQDKGGLRLYGDVRSDDELQVLRQYVGSNFGLDDWQTGQMIVVRVRPMPVIQQSR